MMKMTNIDKQLTVHENQQLPKPNRSQSNDQASAMEHLFVYAPTKTSQDICGLVLLFGAQVFCESAICDVLKTFTHDALLATSWRIS